MFWKHLYSLQIWHNSAILNFKSFIQLEWSRNIQPENHKSMWHPNFGFYVKFNKQFPSISHPLKKSKNFSLHSFSSWLPVLSRIKYNGRVWAKSRGAALVALIALTPQEAILPLESISAQWSSLLCAVTFYTSYTPDREQIYRLYFEL